MKIASEEEILDVIAEGEPYARMLPGCIVDVSGIPGLEGITWIFRGGRIIWAANAEALYGKDTVLMYLENAETRALIELKVPAEYLGLNPRDDKLQ